MKKDPKSGTTKKDVQPKPGKKETGPQRRLRLIREGLCTACGKRKPARRHDGKIKEAPPDEGQAIDMAWPRAGASVGSRAARRRKMRFFKPHAGTCLRETRGMHL